MTTMLPSPFLTESASSVELQSSVSTAAAASSPVPPAIGEAAEPFEASLAEIDSLETGHIHEIFHHGRRLIAEAQRRQALDRGCLAAVAAALEAWRDEQDPPPLFLRREA